MSNASSFPASDASPDRRGIWLRRFAATCLGGALLAAGLVVWAFAAQPIEGNEVEIARQPPSVTSRTQAQVLSREVDQRPYTRQLWWTLPKPADAANIENDAKPEQQILPLELELIGVSEIDGSLVAALYDRRADRLRLVRQGERISEADVAEVTRERVRLTRKDGELLLNRRRPGP